jgi:polyhydroxybutyrate depolymerase
MQIWLNLQSRNHFVILGLIISRKGVKSAKFKQLIFLAPLRAVKPSPMKRNILFIFTCCLILPTLSFTQNSTGSFTYNSVLRDYILHIPPGYNASVPTPLVLNLHGYTSNAQQQMLYTGFNSDADTAGYIVVYPNGIANAWNSGWNSPYHSGVDDVGFLSALIDTISENYNIDACRVFSTGMSNGGFMSYRLACELENKIAAVASVTGSMTDSMMFYCQNTRAVAVMEIHGTADNTVPYDGTVAFTSVDENFNFWASHNSCLGAAITEDLADTDPLDGATVTKIHHTTCDASTELITFKINGGAHTWPDAAFTIGVTTHDISANSEILQFFNNHPRCVTSTSLEENSASAVLVFPNPVENTVSVQHDLTGKVKLFIYDLTSKIVYQDTDYKNASSISVDTFLPGVYYAKMINSQQDVITKFVKR